MAPAWVIGGLLDSSISSAPSRLAVLGRILAHVALYVYIIAMCALAWGPSFGLATLVLTQSATDVLLSYFVRHATALQVCGVILQQRLTCCGVHRGALHSHVLIQMPCVTDLVWLEAGVPPSVIQWAFNNPDSAAGLQDMVRWLLAKCCCNTLQIHAEGADSW